MQTYIETKQYTPPHIIKTTRTHTHILQDPDIHTPKQNNHTYTHAYKKHTITNNHTIKTHLYINTFKIPDINTHTLKSNTHKTQNKEPTTNTPNI